jgi:hypothetical protein
VAGLVVASIWKKRRTNSVNIAADPGQDSNFPLVQNLNYHYFFKNDTLF